MHIRTSRASWLKLAGDALVVFLPKDSASIEKSVKTLEKTLNHTLHGYLEQRGFEGKKGEVLVLPLLAHSMTERANPAYRALMFVGTGEHAPLLDEWRKLMAQTVKAANRERFTRVVFSEEGTRRPRGATFAQVIGAMAEGAWLTGYRYHTYRTELASHEHSHVSDICFAAVDAANERLVRTALNEAEALALGVHVARDLVNTPPSDLPPSAMVDAARRVADADPRVSIEVFDREAMQALGMGAALAVARGSEHAPFMVHLVFKPKGKALKKVAVVGKAVTFDSGGLSIKPSKHMETMKCDMAGAAAVIGLFQALPALAPQVEVHGLFIAVENMPSGAAYRPGDVVRAMNGKTIEVLNTDAEGRLTLADALSYVSAKVKPDAVIDLATLTGAAVVAVGEEITALFANTDAQAQDLIKASVGTGETLCRLPLFAPYKQLVASKIADLKNTGNGSAGAITAALFLEHFVPTDVPWAHLDIAGPAFMERDSRPDIPHGGTGVGVRLLARYLQAFHR